MLAESTGGIEKTVPAATSHSLSQEVAVAAS